MPCTAYSNPKRKHSTEPMDCIHPGRIPPLSPWTPSASQARHLPHPGKGDRGAVEGVLISLPCFLSEQISELLCIGDVLRTEHFSQVKDPLGGYFDFFWKSVS